LLNIPYKKLESYHDLWILEHGSGSIYCLDITCFENEINTQIMSDPLHIQTGKKLSMDECIKKLIDL
jgi:hypothetical protein